MSKIAVTILLTLMGILMISSTLNDAATVDEPTHIFAGLTYLKFRDLRQNPEHPPLIKLLSGLSLIAFYPDLHFPFTFEEIAPALSFSITDYGAKMFLLNDPTKYLLLARLPIMTFTIFGGVMVFLLAKSLGGNRAGTFSLMLYVFEPNILAHGKLVTTDAGLMVFTLFLVFALYRFWQTRSIFWFVFSSIASTLLLLTKYSSLLVLPTILGSFFLCLIFFEKNRKVKIAMFSSLCALVVLSWAGIWGFYSLFKTADFDYQNAPEIIKIMESVEPHWFIELFKRQILPSYFRHGASIVAAHNHYGQQFVLFGDFGNFNKLYLYPTIFLFKTPITLLVLVLVGFFYSIKQLTKTYQQSQKILAIFLFLSAIFYFFILLSSGIFFGIRNVLPFTSILIVLAGPSVYWWLKKGIKLKLFFIIVSLYLLENFLTFPSYIAYGNQFFGSSEKKMASLVDSNIDWGQDLKRLSIYLKSQGVTKLPFQYFGTVPPEAFGITPEHLPIREEKERPSGYLAVSVSNKNYAYRIKNPDGSIRFLFKPYSYLDGIEPVKIIGDSIVVYQLP